MIINAYYDVILVTFKFQGTENKHIFSPSSAKEEDIIYIFTMLSHKGIESIKSFDTKDNKFKRISKEVFLNMLSHREKLNRYFKNHYYFRKS